MPARHLPPAACPHRRRRISMRISDWPHCPARTCGATVPARPPSIRLNSPRPPVPAPSAHPPPPAHCIPLRTNPISTEPSHVLDPSAALAGILRANQVMVPSHPHARVRPLVSPSQRWERPQLTHICHSRPSSHTAQHKNVSSPWPAPMHPPPPHPFVASATQPPPFAHHFRVPSPHADEAHVCMDHSSRFGASGPLIGPRAMRCTWFHHCAARRRI